MQRPRYSGEEQSWHRSRGSKCSVGARPNTAHGGDVRTRTGPFARSLMRSGAINLLDTYLMKLFDFTVNMTRA